MNLNRNTQSVFGILAVILSLSPFTESIRKLVICEIFGVTITALNIYFLYTISFVVLVSLMFYFEAYYSKNSNIDKKLKFSKNINFFIIQFLPPLFI